jgi:EcsC protein family
MKHETLTAYEGKVVRRIAAWKGRRPGLVSRAMEALKRPLDWGLRSVIPGKKAAGMLAKLNDRCDCKAGYELIRREAGVDNLVRLRKGSLEDCDRLERRVQLADAGVATSESLLAGVGGLATEMAAIPAEALLALKSIHRVAGCYGYPLKGARDRTMVLAVIGLSMIGEPEERVKWCEKIRSLENGPARGNDTRRLGEPSLPIFAARPLKMLSRS